MVHLLNWFRFNSAAVPEYWLCCHVILVFISTSRRYIFTLCGFEEKSWKYVSEEICQSSRKTTLSCLLRWCMGGVGCLTVQMDGVSNPDSSWLRDSL